MKVLLLNGSTRKNGCTFTALSEIAKTLNEEKIETEILQMGVASVQDCMACNKCAELGKCIFNKDIVNVLIEKAKTADGFVFGSPVYYGHPTGQIQAVLNRVFYAATPYFEHKPAATIVTARRGGATASFDVINKYFTVSQMPIVSSTYWNMVHGKTPQDIKQDLEGLQTMRNLARNMSFILKCIDLGKQHGLTVPKAEKENYTDFIR